MLAGVEVHVKFLDRTGRARQEHRVKFVECLALTQKAHFAVVRAPERWRVRSDGPEDVRVHKALIQRTPGPHGHSTQGSMLEIRLRSIGRIDVPDQVLHQIIAPARPAVRVVNPVAFVALRQNDEHRR